MAAQSQGPPYVACPCSRTASFFSLLPPFPSSAPFSLPIPPAFLRGRNVLVDKISAPAGLCLTSDIQLEGPSGATWPVVMRGPTWSNLAFTTGWEKFVKDHSLVAGDLLIFKLLSRGSFSVSIYGSDGCEKAEALTARSASHAQILKKRPAVDGVLQGVGVDAYAKKRKVDIDKQITPHIIDIDDDDDEDEVHADIAESRDTCRFGVESSLDCTIDPREDKCSQPIPVDEPLTPSNADKSILAIKMQIPINSINKEDGTSDQERLVHNSGANGSEQEATSSEEEDVEQHDHQQECVQNGEMSSECDSEKKDFEDSLYCTDEATQQGRMNDVLAKDYLTEAFISRRRPVSVEERQSVLRAAERFRSSLPHSTKLMKESHVYRGFWLGLPSDFSIKYLPLETQQATLLDSSGKAWSAKWLGSRNGLSGGWRKFSLDHGLEEGDVCVFELIDRTKLVIKVHIFRVVELKNRLPGKDHYLRKPQSRSLLDYNCRRPSTCVKKMRGAIADKTGSLHSSTLSSTLKQAEDKKWQGKDDTPSICKKSESRNRIQIQPRCSKAQLINRSQISKDMLNSKTIGTGAGGCSASERSVQRNAQREGKSLSVCNIAGVSSSSKTLPKAKEPVPEKGKGDTHYSFKKAESINNVQISKNLVRTHGADEGGYSNAERSLQKKVDVGAQREFKTVSVCSTAETSSSLQTPSKTRECVPVSLRTRLLRLAPARQLEPLLKATQSGLLKHPDGSELNSCKKYYTVERLYNRRKGPVEEEFLVDLDIDESLTGFSSKISKDGSAWWVPLSHFTKDKTSCHL